MADIKDEEDNTLCSDQQIEKTFLRRHATNGVDKCRM